MLAGGVKLGEGSTSWIIEPALPCNGESGEGLVTKLFISYSDTHGGEMNEKILKKLRKLDPAQSRFIYPTSVCDKIPKDLSEAQKDAVFEVTGKRPSTTEGLVYFNMPKVMKADFPLTAPRADFVRQSVELLHEDGIIHRDLHKNNIMMGPDAKPRIIDFGLAQLSKSVKKQREDSSMLEKFLEAPKSVKKSRALPSSPRADAAGGRKLAFD
jgi:serine/threonine protein kinase